MKYRITLILLIVLMTGCFADSAVYSTVSPAPRMTASPAPPTATFTASLVPPTATFTSSPVPPTTTNIPLPESVDVSGEIIIWYAYTSAATGEYRAMADVTYIAGKRFPNLAIKPVQVPFNEIYSKFQAEASTGNGPDLLLAPNDQLGSMVRNQLLLQLDPYVQGRLEDISSMGIQGMQVDGKLYGIPESSKVVALYYKKSLVNDPPETTDELLSLVRDGNLLVNPLNAYHLFGWVNAFGGQLFDENDRCIAYQGGWDKALSYLLELKDAGAIFEPDTGIAENLFLRGGASMLIDGSWVLKDYQKVFGDNLGVVPMPTGPQGPAGPFVGIDGFYVNRFSKNKEAAISLALFLTNEESGQIFSDRGGHVPVNMGVTSTDPLLLAFSQAVDYGTVRPQSREFDNYWGPFGYMFMSVLEGEVLPKFAPTTACLKMNQANGK